MAIPTSPMEIVTDSGPGYCPALSCWNRPPTLNFSRLARGALAVFAQAVVLLAPSTNVKSKEQKNKKKKCSTKLSVGGTVAQILLM